MKRLWKAQQYRLFCAIEPIMYVLIGSVLAIAMIVLYGLYQSVEYSKDMNAFSIQSIQSSYFIFLSTILIVEVILTCNIFSSKTVYYEIMSGHTVEGILSSRFINSLVVVIALVFCSIAYLLGYGYMKEFSKDFGVREILIRCVLLFFLLLHKAIVLELYIMVFRNAIVSVGVGLIIQYGVLEQLLQGALSKVCAQDLIQWFSSHQFVALWEHSTDVMNLVKKILVSFVIESMITFVIVRYIYKRREWK